MYNTKILQNENFLVDREGMVRLGEITSFLFVASRICSDVTVLLEVKVERIM